MADANVPSMYAPMVEAPLKYNAMLIKSEGCDYRIDSGGRSEMWVTGPGSLEMLYVACQNTRI